MHRCRFVLDDGERHQKEKAYRRMTDEVKTWRNHMGFLWSMPGPCGKPLSAWVDEVEKLVCMAQGQ